MKKSKYICIISLIIILIIISLMPQKIKATGNKFIVYKYEDKPTLKISVEYADIAEETEKEYIKLLDAIPDEIVLKLKNKNVKIHLTSNSDCKKEYGRYAPKTLLGFYAYPDIIYVTIEDMSWALYHEIGHAVDFLNGHMSNSKDFIEAYKKDIEKKVIKPDDRCEEYADIFKSYMFCLLEPDNYYTKSELVRDYPNVIVIFQEKLNLPGINEGYAFSPIKSSRWRIVQSFYNAKKIENISKKITNIINHTYRVENIFYRNRNLWRKLIKEIS